jgi:hypothetical protein
MPPSQPTTTLEEPFESSKISITTSRLLTERGRAQHPARTFSFEECLDTQ